MQTISQILRLSSRLLSLGKSHRSRALSGFQGYLHYNYRLVRVIAARRYFFCSSLFRKKILRLLESRHNNLVSLVHFWSTLPQIEYIMCWFRCRVCGSGGEIKLYYCLVIYCSFVSPYVFIPSKYRSFAICTHS